MQDRNIPAEAVKLKTNVLAEGEHTGHFHAAVGPDVSLYDVGGTMVIDAPQGATIEHQEHNDIVLPPGQYERYIVQEWDHFKEEANQVRD